MAAADLGDLDRAVAELEQVIALDETIHHPDLERDRAEGQLRDILRTWLLQELLTNLPQNGLADTAARVAERTIDPYTAAEELLGWRRLD